MSAVIPPLSTLLGGCRRDIHILLDPITLLYRLKEEPCADVEGDMTMHRPYTRVCSIVREDEMSRGRENIYISSGRIRIRSNCSIPGPCPLREKIHVVTVVVNWVCNRDRVVEMPEDSLSGIVARIDSIRIVERGELIRLHGLAIGLCHEKSRDIIVSTIRNTIHGPQPVAGGIGTERDLIVVRFSRNLRCLRIERCEERRIDILTGRQIVWPCLSCRRVTFIGTGIQYGSKGN